MSEAAARIRQPIDLDEFERRLRAGELGSRGSNDPVAELARLVGHADPFGAPAVMHQLRPAAEHRSASHLQQVYSAQAVHENINQDGAVAQEPYLSVIAVDDGHAIVHDQLEAPELRGASHGDEASWHQSPSTDAARGYVVSPDDLDAAFVEQGVAPASIAAERDVPRRSWRGVIILSTILATGFAGLAAALTMKGSLLAVTKGPVAHTAGGVPVILAGGPTKIQPEKSVADQADDHLSALDKTGSVKAPAKVINSVESPVDLSQQKPTVNPLSSVAVEPHASMSAGLPAQGSNTVVASIDPSNLPSMSLKSVAPPAASSTGANSFDDASPPSTGPAGFPTPKRVKVISVRPDGSVIGEQEPASSPQPAPPQSAAPEATVPPPPTPREQVASLDPAAPRVNDPVAGLIDRTPVKPAVPEVAKTERPGKPDARSTGTKSAKRVKAKSTEVADLGNTTPTEVSRGDGAFVAQLAASPTEAAAKATLRKLQKKYGGALGGHRLSYRRAKVDGKIVYRVRVGSLSRADADGVCSKLQADGGSCFVAGK